MRFDFGFTAFEEKMVYYTTVDLSQLLAIRLEVFYWARHCEKFYSWLKILAIEFYILDKRFL